MCECFIFFFILIYIKLIRLYIFGSIDDDILFLFLSLRRSLPIRNCVGPIHLYGCGHRCGINGTDKKYTRDGHWNWEDSNRWQRLPSTMTNSDNGNAEVTSADGRKFLVLLRDDSTLAIVIILRSISITMWWYFVMSEVWVCVARYTILCLRYHRPASRT